MQLVQERFEAVAEQPGPSYGPVEDAIIEINYAGQENMIRGKAHNGKQYGLRRST